MVYGYPVDGEWRAFGYDDANHLTLATNGTGAYWNNFIADGALMMTRTPHNGSAKGT